MTLPPRLSGYEVLGRLARGSMAEVWLARPEGESTLVVLKRALPHLAREPSVIESLRAEARWLGRIDHPGVVTVRELHETDGLPVLVLAYLEGVSLGALLDAQARHGLTLAPGVVQRIGAELLAGLGAVHGAGVVHGDMTPGNVQVGVDGVTRLIDLGLAAATGELTSPTWQGTAAYTAPERWEPGPRRPAAEVFSAAVVLWEALRGERLFGGRGVLAVRQRIVDEDAPRVDSGRPELAPWAGVLAAALARDPATRTPSVASLAASWREAAPAADRSAVSALVAAVTNLRRPRPGE